MKKNVYLLVIAIIKSLVAMSEYVTCNLDVVLGKLLEYFF